MIEDKIIRVFEHEKLTLSNKKFNAKHLNALITLNEANKNKFFTLIRDGVKFSEYVGVIQAADITIEILPKADRESIPEESTKLLWRDVLLDMLKECKLLKVNHADTAMLNLRSNSILEIYIEMFLNETESLMRNGLVKKYRNTEGNRMALKGRLDFTKHLNKNIIHQEIFYVHYSEYSNDNIYNRILLKTLQVIPKISSSPFLADKLNRLLLNFPELPDIKVSISTFEKLIFDRKTEKYKEALLISKMLLLNFRPDISGGRENVIAILIDMNRLWEEFIYRRLKKEESFFGIKVDRQQKAEFWRGNNLNISKTIRPDLVIEYNKKQIIIDTKWKVLNSNIPSDDDLQQIFLYNLFWDCDEGILLYPSASNESSFGDYHDHTDGERFLRKCSVEKFVILKDGKLKKELGKEILEKVLKLTPSFQV